MKKPLLIAFFAFDALLMGLIVLIFVQPDEVRVQRSATVSASVGDVFPLINDFANFPSWSPWQELDPGINVATSDPSSGPGAWYTWEGNDDVGKGKMTNLATVDNTSVSQDLAFLEPFESNAKVLLEVKAVDGGTEVTWTMDIEQGFVAKGMSLVMDMDQMVGGDFERGLTNLQREGASAAAQRQATEKASAEATAEPPSEGDDDSQLDPKEGPDEGSTEGG